MEVKKCCQVGVRITWDICLAQAGGSDLAYFPQTVYISVAFQKQVGLKPTCYSLLPGVFKGCKLHCRSTYRWTQPNAKMSFLTVDLPKLLLKA